MDNYKREQRSKELAEEVKAIVRSKDIDHHNPVEIDVSNVAFDDRGIFKGVVSSLMDDSRFEFRATSSDYDERSISFQKRPNA